MLTNCTIFPEVAGVLKFKISTGLKDLPIFYTPLKI